MERAKLIGIRRRLSDTMRRMELGSKDVGPLEDFGVSCAIRFVGHYLRRAVTERELWDLEQEFRSQMKALLTFFGRGDDLLLGASTGDFRVVGDYFTAIMLRAWVLGRRKAASMSVKGQRARIRESGLPVGVCKEIAQSQGWPAAVFEEIFESQTTGLPAQNYFNLVKHPFFRFGGEIHVMDVATFNDWPAMIQSRAIQGGAMAKRYGGLWEDYCAKLFADFGWLILGTNIKVKSEGQTLTDIDILALKNGLLLVIQFKSLGIGAATVYEHWLARSKIIEGSRQAKLAIEKLQPGSALLRGLLASKKVKEWPTRVQPLVVTTAEIFTGWNYGQVPVASIKSLVSILNGAMVKFTTSVGAVVSTEKFIQGEEASPEEFLGLLNLSLDWRIADDEEQIQYKIIETKFGKISTPELTRKRRPRAKIDFCGASVANL